MKTLSPGAVIFGPMIAIVTESIIIEASVRLSGRTIALGKAHLGEMSWYGIRFHEIRGRSKTIEIRKTWHEDALLTNPDNL